MVIGAGSPRRPALALASSRPRLGRVPHQGNIDASDCRMDINIVHDITNVKLIQRVGDINYVFSLAQAALDKKHVPRRQNR
jgi:hypothetical protein